MVIPTPNGRRLPTTAVVNPGKHPRVRETKWIQSVDTTCSYTDQLQNRFDGTTDASLGGCGFIFIRRNAHKVPPHKEITSHGQAKTAVEPSLTVSNLSNELQKLGE